MKIVSRWRTRTAARARHAERGAIRFLTRGWPGALTLGIAAAALAVPASASAATEASPVVGHVYVNDNTAGTNTIGAFDRHADGTLTPAAGSPFAAGGAGTGTGLASQGAIQITPHGQFLIAVDAGSSQVSVLRIHAGGSLSVVPGGVVSSGGTRPDSVAVFGNLVYVANSGVGDANYTGFRLGPTGRLHPIPGSTVALAAGAAPDLVQRAGLVFRAVLRGPPVAGPVPGQGGLCLGHHAGYVPAPPRMFHRTAARGAECRLALVSVVCNGGRYRRTMS